MRERYLSCWHSSLTPELGCWAGITAAKWQLHTVEKSRTQHLFLLHGAGMYLHHPRDERRHVCVCMYQASC